MRGTWVNAEAESLVGQWIRTGGRAHNVRTGGRSQNLLGNKRLEPHQKNTECNYLLGR